MQPPLRPRAALVLAALLVGCGADPAVRTARQGDFPALGRDLDARAGAGKLGADLLRDVSRAVLEHDAERYDGDEGVRRTSGLASCARPLEGTLDRLAKRSDEIGAAAAAVLVDAELEAKDAFTDAHKDDALPRWRAVATRGLYDRSEGALRLARSRDDDRWVRLGAVEAAGDAGCAGDFPLLLDAARHDPEVIVRVAAVRAIDRLAPRLAEGTARADLVDRLRDLHRDGDESLRGAVARAWGSPALFPVGGERELLAVVGNEHGHAAVEAASALMLAGSPEGELALVRFSNEGDSEVRAHAIRLLDATRPAHFDALQGLIKEPDAQKEGPVDDPRARELAAETVLRAPASRLDQTDAGKRLRVAATDALKKLSSRADRLGADAALALADAGDGSMRERLQKELAIASPMRPRVAAALVRLGFGADARALLADADLDVRDAVACQVLGGSRR